MDDAALTESLRILLAKQEILEVIMRYCRGIDRKDRELILSVFHPDAIDDHGTGTLRSPEDLAQLVVEGEQEYLMHFMGNVMIEVDRDAAFAESYFISFCPDQRAGKTYTRTRAGRYLDRFEARSGEWRIAYRRVVDEWGRLDEVGLEPDDLGIHHGARSRDDMVFHLRRVLTAPPQTT
jgi:hypothetical protein